MLPNIIYAEIVFVFLHLQQNICSYLLSYGYLLVRVVYIGLQMFQFHFPGVFKTLTHQMQHSLSLYSNPFKKGYDKCKYSMS